MFNKTKIKRILAIICALLTASTSVAFAADDQQTSIDNIKIVIDSEQILPKDADGDIVKPFIVSGTTYLPVRAVSEALGKEVSWDGETKTVFIGEKPEKITFLDSVETSVKIVIDGTQILPKDADGDIVDPFIINGTTYLPVRAVSEALGKEVSWDGETKTVFIGKKIEKLGYTLDKSTTDAFKEKTLATVQSSSISGGMLNFLVTQNAQAELLSYYCDNYTPYGSLQTLTIDSVPVAQILAEQAFLNVKAIFATADAAETAGFSKSKDVEEAILTEWKNLCAAIGDESAYESFANDFSCSFADLETLVKKELLANLYLDELRKSDVENIKKASTVQNEVRDNYITALHILVKEEALAKEIITLLDQGEQFLDLMKKHNTDPGETEAGYTFTKGEMVLPFEEAAFALSEGTYTKEPVKTDYGYHVIYRVPLDELQIEDIVSRYADVLASQNIETFLDTLLEAANVTFTPDYENYITTIK